MAQSLDCMCVQFVTEQDLLLHYGPGLYTSAPWGGKRFSYLVKHELSSNPLQIAAKHTNIKDSDIKALWRNVNRENRTNRPHALLQNAWLLEAASTHPPSSAEFRPGVFVEEKADGNGCSFGEPGILIFFKYYDPSNDDLYFIGHHSFQADSDPISAVIPVVQQLLKSEHDDFDLYEEVTSTMVELIDQTQSLTQVGLETGDILIVQRKNRSPRTVFQHFLEHREYQSLEENRSRPAVLTADNYPTVYARHTLAKLGLSTQGTAGNLQQRMEEHKLTKLEAESNKKIADNMRGCLSNGTCCDITLQVEKAGRTFQAHRLVLCRSPFFKALITGSNFKESGQSTISVDEDPDILNFVLDYLYGKRLADPCCEIDLVQLHSASHRLMIEELKQSCEQKLMEGVTAENALTLLRHAELHAAAGMYHNTSAATRFHTVTTTTSQLTPYLPLFCIRLTTTALKQRCMSVAGEVFGTIATSDAYHELVKQDRALHDELISAVFSKGNKRQRR
jgi:hypothetical protein